jgi:PAS domain S-box-containing protein
MDSTFYTTSSTFRTHEVARQVREAAQELHQKLSQEKARLRAYGVGLPRNTLEIYNEIIESFDKIATRLQDNQLELLQLRNLAKTTELINSSLDLNYVLQDVMDRVVQLVGAERGYIVLKDENTGELSIAIARKIKTRIGADEELSFSRTVVRRVMETNEPVVSTNAQEDPRFDSQGSIAGYNLLSIICVPLAFRGQVIGAVYCDNRVRDGMFGRREMRLLSGFANQAAIAIENAKFFDQLNKTLREITEIKTLLDNILASIASGVVTTDAREVVTIYNTAAENIFGRVSAQTLGLTLDVALPPLYYEIRGNIHQLKRGQEMSSVSIETELEIERRGKVNLNLRLSTLKNSANEPQGLAMVADDFTEIKRRDITLAAVRRYLPPVVVDNIQQLVKLDMGGERREITTMYVDVRPYDTFAADMPPRLLMETLNTYLTIATEGIHHHAGLVDKYMGSEVMCLYNTQLNPMDDHAWQAVQTALRIAADLETLAKYMQQGVADQAYYRIGINTGIATLGNLGNAARREFSAIGDSVNLAKRVQENANLTQILISQYTLAVCREQLENTPGIAYKEYKTVQVKGRSQPTTLYEVYRV